MGGRNSFRDSLVRDLEASLEFWRDLLGFDAVYDGPDEGFAYLDFHGAQLMNVATMRSGNGCRGPSSPHAAEASTSRSTSLPSARCCLGFRVRAGRSSCRVTRSGTAPAMPKRACGSSWSKIPTATWSVWQSVLGDAPLARPRNFRRPIRHAPSHGLCCPCRDACGTTFSGQPILALVRDHGWPRRWRLGRSGHARPLRGQGAPAQQAPGHSEADIVYARGRGALVSRRRAVTRRLT